MSTKPINQAQASRLWAIAYSQGLKKSEVRAIFSEFGITSTAEITMELYEQIINRIAEYAIAEF